MESFKKYSLNDIEFFSLNWILIFFRKSFYYYLRNFFIIIIEDLYVYTNLYYFYLKYKYMMTSFNLSAFAFLYDAQFNFFSGFYSFVIMEIYDSGINFNKFNDNFFSFYKPIIPLYNSLFFWIDSSMVFKLFFRLSYITRVLYNEYIVTTFFISRLRCILLQNFFNRKFFNFDLLGGHFIFVLLREVFYFDLFFGNFIFFNFFPKNVEEIAIVDQEDYMDDFRLFRAKERSIFSSNFFCYFLENVEKELFLNDFFQDIFTVDNFAFNDFLVNSFFFFLKHPRVFILKRVKFFSYSDVYSFFFSNFLFSYSFLTFFKNFLEDSFLQLFYDSYLFSKYFLVKSFFLDLFSVFDFFLNIAYSFRFLFLDYFNFLRKIHYFRIAMRLIPNKVKRTDFSHYMFLYRFDILSDLFKRVFFFFDFDFCSLLNSFNFFLFWNLLTFRSLNVFLYFNIGFFDSFFFEYDYHVFFNKYSYLKNMLEYKTSFDDLIQYFFKLGFFMEVLSGSDFFFFFFFTDLQHLKCLLWHNSTFNFFFLSYSFFLLRFYDDFLTTTEEIF